MSCHIIIKLLIITLLIQIFINTLETFKHVNFTYSSRQLGDKAGPYL